MTARTTERGLSTMTLACQTCPTIRTRHIHHDGRLEAVGVFLAGWDFHRCDGIRYCPRCLRQVRAACDRCSGRTNHVSQLGDPTTRRRRYSRAEVAS